MATFHWRNNWYFTRREDDSTVIMEHRVYEQRDGAYTDTYTCDVQEYISPSDWAGIVASVSASGETGEAWALARNFHEGKEVAGALPS